MKSVLFLCTGNSARSQMAEGLLRNVAGKDFAVSSAGLEPKGIHPLAVKAMTEIDIDITKQQSQSVSEFSGTEYDFIITLCSHANQQCPYFPGKSTRLHWDLSDPAASTGKDEEKLIIFRNIRDQIKNRINNFLAKFNN